MLQAAVFAKSLKLSSKARFAYPASKIINISSTDVQSLRIYASRVHDLWSSLFQIIAIAALIFLIIGTSCFYGLSLSNQSLKPPLIFSGFATIFVLLASQCLTNIYKANIVKNYITSNDQRLKILREFLYHVKGVKVLALENRFLNRISKIRTIQLGWIKKWLELDFAVC